MISKFNVDWKADGIVSLVWHTWFSKWFSYFSTWCLRFNLYCPYGFWIWTWFSLQ